MNPLPKGSFVEQNHEVGTKSRGGNKVILMKLWATRKIRRTATQVISGEARHLVKWAWKEQGPFQEGTGQGGLGSTWGTEACSEYRSLLRILQSGRRVGVGIPIFVLRPGFQQMGRQALL